MAYTTLLGVLVATSHASEYNYIVDPSELECPGNVTYRAVTLTAYHPMFDSDRKRDYLDASNRKLYTLQEYLDNRAPYVTVGMDPTLRLPYGKEACIPELNRHFRRAIRLQVRDTHEDLTGGGFRRVDVCVRTQEDSYDDVVNMLQVTLVL
ncbi:AGAP013413-PA-like protein [Anopheles sinensis]|uniref:AGAP013413-PA-like protein n=1 Tax=Anopheles sinensis TaxID=74873 RepID=A0A084VFM3_ANOSI|nr:AGAP013413-PA-like protein [Anopheles sinensis]